MMKSQKLRVKLVLLSVVRAKIISYLFQGHCTLKNIFNLILQLYPNCLHYCCVFSYFNGNFLLSLTSIEFSIQPKNISGNLTWIQKVSSHPFFYERGEIWTYILSKLVHRKFSKWSQTVYNAPNKFLRSSSKSEEYYFSSCQLQHIRAKFHTI